MDTKKRFPAVRTGDPHLSRHRQGIPVVDHRLVRAARQGIGMTVEDAAGCALSTKTIFRSESPIGNPGPKTVSHLARTYGVPALSFFSIDGVPLTDLMAHLPSRPPPQQIVDLDQIEIAGRPGRYRICGVVVKRRETENDG